MSLQFKDIDDAVLLTQTMLVQRGAFLDLQTDLTDHVAVREMWQGRQKKFTGGTDWEFQAQVDHNHSARAVGLFETDGSSFGDSFVTGKTGIRHMNAHYIYDQREQAFQRGGTAIVDLVRSRYVGMMVSFYELLESYLWSKPVDSTDDKTPFGIPYWITKNATEGFNGGNPAGFTAGRAGISTIDQPRWANYTAQYANVSKEDLVRKMRRAHRVSVFRSPVSHSQPSLGGTSNGIYANDETIGLLEELCEAQNMDLGNDLASRDGRVMFKSSPLTYAPLLDDDSTDPVYMIDWKWMAIGVMEGWENNLSEPQPIPGKHTVRRVDLDASLNTVCTNLRRQSVISKA